nr:hypothetical protein CFP56_77977 [Quercus suber]
MPPDPPTTTFSSSTDYFNYAADQDLHHLKSHLNSVDDEPDARSKYVHWNVAKMLVPRFTSSDSRHSPFKLICDDFGPADMIVDSTKYLKIVAVIDWEWSYAGPEELLWSPPRWLVLEASNAWSTSTEDNLTRYNKYFEMYVKMIEEQEVNILGEHLSMDKRPSALLRQRHQDGSAWFYYIIRDSFNGPTLMPWVQLRAAVPDFDEMVKSISQEELETFVSMKIDHLKLYSTLLAAKQE